MNTVMFVKPNGEIDVREQPHVSEVGGEEAWAFNMKDMVDDHSVRRSALSSAWNDRYLRGASRQDKFEDLLFNQFLDHKEERFDSRQSFKEALRNVTLGQIQVGSQQMQYDPQRVAETAMESGMSAGAQTNQVVQSGIQDILVEILTELRKASSAE